MQTLFRIISTGLLVILLMFSVSLIGNKWLIFQCHVNNAIMLDGFKNALNAMEILSAERGYTNTLLGENINVLTAEKNVLPAIRARTDDALKTLFPVLFCLPTAQRILAVRHMRLLERDLVLSRKEIDVLLSKDKRQRTLDAIGQAIQSEIQLIAYIDNTVGILSNHIEKNNASLLDYMHVIRTATVLRDVAGELGSQLMPAVILGQPLSAQDQQQYRHIRRRIDTLHLMLNQQLNITSNLPQSLFRQQKNRLENNYFRQALRITDGILSVGKISGHYTMTSGQFTDMYVSSMASIVQLRKSLSAYLGNVARTQKERARQLLLLNIGFCLLALLFLYLALHTIHKRMIMPIFEATLLLKDPADSLYKRTPQPMYKTRDEASSLLLSLYALRTGTHPRYGRCQ